MTWHKIEGKQPAEQPTQYLCAWLPGATGKIIYAVLTQYPNGVWTDDLDDDIGPDEMPALWQEIEAPGERVVIRQNLERNNV